MSIYNKDIMPSRNYPMHKVEYQHPGARGKIVCAGNTVRIDMGDIDEFNQGNEVTGYCRGCGFIGKVKKN